MRHVLFNLRHAVAVLRRRPWFTATTVATLALGIAANTTIFALVSATVLRRPVYPEPERLVVVYEVGTRDQEMRTSWPTFKDWRSSGAFETAAAYSAWPNSVLGGDKPELLYTTFTSKGFFDVFRAKAALGRLPGRDEAAPIAVVSDRFWRRSLGSKPIAGRHLEVEGMSFDVVGVMPPAFDYPPGSDVWVLGEGVGPEPPPYRSAHNWDVVARLAPGIALEEAALRIDQLTRQVATTGPDGSSIDYLPVGAHVRTLQVDAALPVRGPLLLLLGAAAFVLLVASLNLASSFLARGLERERELAVRLALGASRRALLRQLVAEATVLAALGAVAGVALALSLGRALVQAAPPLLADVGLQLDGKVGGYTVAAAVLAVLLSGLLPALLVTRAPASGLRGGRSEGISPAQRRTWSALVAVQVCLALLLLGGAGLLLRSFGSVLAISPGFDDERVATMGIAPPSSRYPDHAAIAGLERRLLEALAAALQVETAGLVSELPLGGDQGGQMKAAPDKLGSASYRVVSGGYFRTLRIPLLEGRLFDARDGLDAPHAALVDRAAAELFWPGQDPIGKRISSEGMDEWGISEIGQAEPKQWATVVGVVGGVRHRALEADVRPSVYFALSQRPRAGVTLVARSRTTAAALFPVLQQALASVAADVPADEPAPLTDVLVQARAQKRFALMLLGVFAALALLLAAVGIYGVVAYAVSRRTRELGVRLALGAAPSQARSLLVRGALVPVAIGAAAALLLAVPLMRGLAAMLYEVKPWDPASWLVALLLLGVAATFAAWVPARRAAAIDPMRSLRAE